MDGIFTHTLLLVVDCSSFFFTRCRQHVAFVARHSPYHLLHHTVFADCRGPVSDMDVTPSGGRMTMLLLLLRKMTRLTNDECRFTAATTLETTLTTFAPTSVHVVVYNNFRCSYYRIWHSSAPNIQQHLLLYSICYFRLCRLPQLGVLRGIYMTLIQC